MKPDGEGEIQWREMLEDWYQKHGRELPWRETKDPYLIWISEVILQQTRVAQGLDYFRRFVERFPDVLSLAEAKEDEVLKYWQGLGYYSRARNLHAAARDIRDRFGGKFPETYEAVRSLKGIGEYTAAAICSFAWDQPYAVVDGNVYRVLSRVFGIDIPIDSPKGKKFLPTLPDNYWIKINRLYTIRPLWISELCNVSPNLRLVYFVPCVTAVWLWQPDKLTAYLSKREKQS